MFLTGVMMCLASLTYGVVIQNDPPLRIHFPDAVLRPEFNYAFYLTGATGLLTALCACLIILMDILVPRKIATIFHHAIIEEDTFFDSEVKYLTITPNLIRGVASFLGVDICYPAQF